MLVVTPEVYEFETRCNLIFLSILFHIKFLAKCTLNVNPGRSFFNRHDMTRYSGSKLLCTVLLPHRKARYKNISNRAITAVLWQNRARVYRPTTSRVIKHPIYDTLTLRYRNYFRLARAHTTTRGDWDPCAPVNCL